MSGKNSVFMLLWGRGIFTICILNYKFNPFILGAENGKILFFRFYSLLKPQTHHQPNINEIIAQNSLHFILGPEEGKVSVSQFHPLLF